MVTVQNYEAHVRYVHVRTDGVSPRLEGKVESIRHVQIVRGGDSI